MDARMKCVRLVAMACLAAGSIGCHIEVVGVDGDDDWDRYEVTAETSRTLEVAGETALTVLGQNGEVRIRGVTEGESLMVCAERTVRSYSRRDAEEHLDLLQVSVRREGGELVVETVQPQHSGRRDYVVDYQITLPRALAVRVMNGNGAVRVEELDAELRVENGNGSVLVRDQRGSSWITVGNGHIDSRVEMPEYGQVVHKVGNGWIRLDLPGSVSAQFGAFVGNGSISHSGLPFTSMASGPGVLQGTLGSGAGLIDLMVGNGWVEVTGY